MSAEIFKKLLNNIDSLSGVNLNTLTNDSEIAKAYMHMQDGYKLLNNDQKEIFSNVIKNEVNVGNFYGKPPEENLPINHDFGRLESNFLRTGHSHTVSALLNVGAVNGKDVTGPFKSIMKAYGAATEPQPQNIPFSSPVDVPQNITSFESPITSSSELSFSSDLFSNLDNTNITHEDVNLLLEDADRLPVTTLDDNFADDPFKFGSQTKSYAQDADFSMGFNADQDPDLIKAKTYGKQESVKDQDVDSAFENIIIKETPESQQYDDEAYLSDDDLLEIDKYHKLQKSVFTFGESEIDSGSYRTERGLRPEERDLLMMESPNEILSKAKARGVLNPNYKPKLTQAEAQNDPFRSIMSPKSALDKTDQLPANTLEKEMIDPEDLPINFDDKTVELDLDPTKEYVDSFLESRQWEDDIPGLELAPRNHSLPRKPGELKRLNKPKPEAKPVVLPKVPTEKDLAYEARAKTNSNFAKLNKIENFDTSSDPDNVSSLAFNQAVGGKNNRDIQMLKHELVGEARNNNPETVNQRIDFYKKQGVIDEKEAEPLKAFFNTNFENMDKEGVQGFFNQYNENLDKNMTPKQARLSVNQQMDNKTEGFFSTNSEDNFKNFAGRSLIGGAFGAAIGTATDDNPEAGFVAGMVGANVGRNAAKLLRNNTDMFEGKMVNSLLKDNAKGKTRAQQLEAVQDLDDESLDFMDKMYKDKLTNNFGTKNMFENSAVTGSRAMTLSGAALAGVAFTPKKRDHRRGFNANRGNRI